MTVRRGDVDPSTNQDIVRDVPAQRGDALSFSHDPADHGSDEEEEAEGVHGCVCLCSGGVELGGLSGVSKYGVVGRSG